MVRLSMYFDLSLAQEPIKRSCSRLDRGREQEKNKIRAKCQHSTTQNNEQGTHQNICNRYRSFEKNFRLEAQGTRETSQINLTHRRRGRMTKKKILRRNFQLNVQVAGVYVCDFFFVSVDE